MLELIKRIKNGKSIAMRFACIVYDAFKLQRPSKSYRLRINTDNSCFEKTRLEEFGALFSTRETR